MRRKLRPIRSAPPNKFPILSISEPILEHQKTEIINQVKSREAWFLVAVYSLLLPGCCLLVSAYCLLFIAWLVKWGIALIPKSILLVSKIADCGLRIKIAEFRLIAKSEIRNSSKTYSICKANFACSKHYVSVHSLFWSRVAVWVKTRSYSIFSAWPRIVSTLSTSPCR